MGAGVYFSTNLTYKFKHIFISQPAQLQGICVGCSVADPDPGSGAFLTPVLGSRIRDKHPGSATLVGWEVRLFQVWPIRDSFYDCLYNISQLAWASQPRLENVQTGLSGLGRLGPETLSHLLAVTSTIYHFRLTGSGSNPNTHALSLIGFPDSGSFPA
jgi:hypothetical protein